MDFVGTGRRLAQGDVGDAARVLGIETAVLLAFLEVEAAGRGFDSRQRPKMLFEPHVFWRNLAGKLREAAAAAGLAYAKWRRDYPKDSYPRLARAIGIAREPAFRSASYGLPQILGENHRAAGFASAEIMFETFKHGEREQLMAMVSLLTEWGLAPLLRGKDFTKPESWEPAVKRYNGKGYKANGYHTKAAAAYVKHSAGLDAKTGKALPPKVLVPAGASLLEEGMKGEAVRVLQADLQALGFTFVHGVDGRFGEETAANVRLFQAGAGIDIDGKAGPETRAAIAASLAAMEADLSPPAPKPAEEPPRASPGRLPIILFLIGLAAAGLFVAAHLPLFS